MASGKLASLLIKIAANGAEAEKEIRKLERKVNDFGKKMKEAGTAMSTYLTAPIVAAGAVAVRSANQQLQAEQRLLTALNGRKDVQERLMQQAAELQSRSIYGDEAIIEQQAFLAALGLTETQINDTINAAAQLSAALGMEFSSAVRNLSKTYSGLAGELGESIPALRNLTAEEMAAGAAIAYVNDNYNGFAETAAQTGTGPLLQLKNTLGDIAEQFGTTLVPVIQKLATKLKEIAEKFQKLSPETRELIVSVAAFVAAIGPLLTIGGKLIMGLRTVIAIIPTLGAKLAMLTANPLAAAITAVGLLAAKWIHARNKMREYEEEVMRSAREGGDEKYGQDLQRVKDRISSFDTDALEKERKSLSAKENKSYAENLTYIAATQILQERAAAQREVASAQDDVIRGVQQEIGLIPQLEAQLRDLNKTLDSATDRDTIARVNEEIEQVRNSLEELRNLRPVETEIRVKYVVFQAHQNGETSQKMKGVNFNPGEGIFKQFGISAEQSQAMLEEAERVAALNGQMSSILHNSFVSATELIGDGLGALISGTDFDFGRKFLELIGTALKQLGMALVEFGTAQVALKEALNNVFRNPWIALGAGAAAMAAGAMLIGVAKKPVKLATGGLAYGPTLAVVGDNPGASSDPEVVAPLSKLSTYLGGQKMELVGSIDWVLEGDSLRAVLNRENVRLTRMGRR